MTTPTPDDQLRPDQTWLDDRGDEWAISVANGDTLHSVRTANVSFQQRNGGCCYCWRPSTPPPGWSRLS